MIDTDKLFQQALNFLSYRDRTEWEMRQYLRKKLRQQTTLPSRKIIKEIVTRLYDLNLLNDQKFVSSWIKSRRQSKFHGPKRLYVDLVKRGVDKDLIRNYLNKISTPTWLKTASNLLQKKRALLQKHETQKQKDRAFRLLVSRGFSYDIAKKAIDSYF